MEELDYGLTMRSDRPRPPADWEDVPWEPIAVLKAEPDELEQRLGVTFQDTFDQLDYLWLAVLDLNDGLRVAFKRYKRSPTGGTHVEILPEQLISIAELRRNLYAAINQIKDGALQRIMDSLGLTPEDFSWIKPHVLEAALELPVRQADGEAVSPDS